MNRKAIAAIAVVMLLVFGATVIVYPMFANPVNDTAPSSVPEPMVPPPAQ